MFRPIRKPSVFYLFFHFILILYMFFCLCFPFPNNHHACIRSSSHHYKWNLVIFKLWFVLLPLIKRDLTDEGDYMFSGEARDDISLLPHNAAIRIFSFLSVVDLFRCAQVCRSWKIMTNSNVLWSKLDLFPIRTKWVISFVNNNNNKNMEIQLLIAFFVDWTDSQTSFLPALFTSVDRFLYA